MQDALGNNIEIFKQKYYSKVHGHDQINICMLQICDKATYKPLLLNTKEIAKNYRPVLILPIFRKIFERLIYNKMYSLFIENDLKSQSQSGFKQGDIISINQPFSITHDIYQSLDQGYELHGVFLNISKAYDKVWREGFIHKLK